MRVKIPLQITEIDPGNYHIIISGSFADNKTASWIIDTGASKTVFDKNLVEYYSILEGETDEIHTAGIEDQPQEISLAVLKSMQIGKFKIENLKVALLDLTHINKLYSKITDLKICGFIGSDFLMENRAIIDYKKRVLILNNSRY
ncbi:MAG: retroviral-like aspartic protease family protein [Draconibacterium sp.]|nr:retroviral-like aspartic protease family protein [Draconibacterium sp.]